MDKESKLRFVDDLTKLKKINLLTIGLTSTQHKKKVQNDIHESNLFVPNNNLKSQEYLDKKTRTY